MQCTSLVMNERQQTPTACNIRFFSFQSSIMRHDIVRSLHVLQWGNWMVEKVYWYWTFLNDWCYMYTIQKSSFWLVIKSEVWNHIISCHIESYLKFLLSFPLHKLIKIQITCFKIHMINCCTFLIQCWCTVLMHEVEVTCVKYSWHSVTCHLSYRQTWEHQVWLTLWFRFNHREFSWNQIQHGEIFHMEPGLCETENLE